MSAPAGDFTSADQDRWRRIAGILALVMVSGYSLWFFAQNVVHYYTDSSVQSLGRYVDELPWIRLHVLGGSLALFAGPWQFWTGLRHRSKRGHKWVGRAYLAGVLLGGAAALNMALTLPGGPDWHAALLGLWAAWWTTTSMAFLAIRKRAFTQHKEWMIRSYGVTLAFTLNRVWYEIPAIARFDPPRAFPGEWDAMLMWLSFVPTLWLIEMVIQGRKILATKSAV